MSIPFRTIFPVWLACLVTAGCGTEDRPTLVPVTGWVTYRGEPVGGAHVCFFGESSEPTAIATTGNDGGFQLTTMDENDGAAPGSYVVTVSKLEGSPVNAAPAIPFGRGIRSPSGGRDRASPDRWPASEPLAPPD